MVPGRAQQPITNLHGLDFRDPCVKWPFLLYAEDENLVHGLHPLLPLVN